MLTGDEHRVIAAMERDLERLLSVEPSPDFARRVRTRIADEKAGAGSPGWRYGLVAAAVVVALVAAGVLRMRSHDQSAAVPVATTAPQETRAAASVPVAAGAPRVPAAVSVPRQDATVAVSRRTGGAQERVARGAELEVLIPDDQRVALRRLVEMARAGTLDERVFPAGARPATDGEPGEAVAPIVVEGLQVAPLITFEWLEGSAHGTGPDN
jgi:hypothetical protein